MTSEDIGPLRGGRGGDVGAKVWAGAGLGLVPTRGMDAAEDTGSMSLGGRLMGVFAGPGEVFEAVAAAGFSVANWLVPAAVAGLVGMIFSLVIFTQAALVQQVREYQEKELDRMVERGRYTAEQAAQAKEAMGGFGMTVARVAGGLAAVVGALVTPFWWGAILWGVGRFVFHPGLSYLKAVEVAGLSSLISALGGLVTMFLAVGFGRLTAGPHLGLLVSELDLTNRLHLCLAAVNGFGLWHLAVMAIGLARLVGRPTRPVLLVLGGTWIGYKAVVILLGWSQMAL